MKRPPLPDFGAAIAPRNSFNGMGRRKKVFIKSHSAFGAEKHAEYLSGRFTRRIATLTESK